MFKFYSLILLYFLAIVLSFFFLKALFLVLFFVYTVILLLIITWGSANIRSQLFVKSISSNPNAIKQVALTVDDGPHPENTYLLLKILAKYNAKASFFFIGENIKKYPKIAQQVYKEGHLIGNHSFYHKNSFPISFPKIIKKEIKQTQDEIFKITNCPNQFFRPPFGVTNTFVFKALKGFNLKVIGWNIRTLDTVDSKDRNKILDKTIRKLRSGDIILLHDKSIHSVWLCEEILKHLESQNIQAVTVEQLIR